MKLKLKHKDKTHEFEIQEMEPLDYYNIQTKLKFGQVDFKDFAQEIISECVVSPIEARKIEYFKDMPRILDVLCGKIEKICDLGLSEKVEVEIIEE